MRGRVYDLEVIYQTLNARYFDDQVDVGLRWFGQAERLRKRSIILGQWVPHRRVIKIHRKLDDPLVPYFFIAYVLYHEMVHVVVPIRKGRDGRRVIHGPEFKAKEQEFKHYRKALAWEKQHKMRLFFNGRT